MDQDPDLILSDGVVTLRAPTQADIPMYVDAVRSSLDHLLPWMAWAHDNYTDADVVPWIEGTFDPGSHRFVVLDADGQFCGSAGLNRLDATNQLADVGYWLHPDATGRGFATRATNLLLRYAIETVGLACVTLYLSVENEASKAVADRSWAHYEGIQRGRLRYDGRQHDQHSYSLMATDPLPWEDDTAAT